MRFEKELHREKRKKSVREFYTCFGCETAEVGNMKEEVSLVGNRST